MNCENCEKTMVGRRRRFCDGSCRTSAFNAKRGGCASRECSDCGKACYGQRCKPCQARAQIKNWCECGWCGDTFVKPLGGSRAGKFCGRPHAFAAASFRARLKKFQHRFKRSLAEVIREQTKTPPVQRTCCLCGGTGVQKRHRLCPACGDRRRKQCDRQCRTTAKARRRAWKRAAVCETVRPHEVFERDNYRCGLCKRKCNRTAHVPNPRSPTLDHIVPLSKGGSHTMGNVQCACFMCNSTKQNKAGSQMRLFG